jgi:rifampicin phosphotransferase
VKYIITAGMGAVKTPAHEKKMQSVKYMNLVKLSECCHVPALTCLTNNEFDMVFENYDDVLNDLSKVKEKINLTSGAFLREQAREVSAIIQSLSFTKNADETLHNIMSGVFGGNFSEGSYAVRSAGIYEDLSNRSYAGIYKSLLNVRGISGLKNAVAEVWKSAYAYNAIFEQLANDQLKDGHGLNVMIQKMVKGSVFGVAFSRHPVTNNDVFVIEYVGDSCEGLVSGAADARRIEIRRNGDAGGGEAPFVPVVLSMLRKVENKLGFDADTEWGWDDGKLWLLQARAMTGKSMGEETAACGPVWMTTDLYGDDKHQIGQMGDLPEFAAYFRKKRKRIFDFAKANGLGRGVALLVKCNAQGLALPENRGRLLRCFKADKVILDFSENLRQIIISRDELISELERLSNASRRARTIVLREFISGEFGLISRTVSATDRSVVCEYSKEGLLAVNRGTARTSVSDVENLGAAMHLSPDVVEQIKQATLNLQKAAGNIQIEWVIENNQAYPLDFSLVKGESSLADYTDTDIISHGYAVSDVFVMEENGFLTDASIAPATSLYDNPEAHELGDLFTDVLAHVEKTETKPIIAVTKPYAALSAVLPHAAGFIFKNASMLCHLSIQLREKGVPAVQSESIYNTVTGGCKALLDTNASPAASIIEQALSHETAGEFRENAVT